MSKGERSRERLLEKASGQFHRRGFRATSVSDLACATGLKKGSLYFYFRGKRALGLAVLERAKAEFIAFLQDALEGPTPWSRLEGFFAAALDKHIKSGFVGGCLWGNTALEMSDEDEQYAGVAAEVFDRWIGMIEEVIADGQRAGEIRRDLSAPALARQVVATVEGGIMLSRLTKSAGPLGDCLNGLRRMLQLEA